MIDSYLRRRNSIHRFNLRQIEKNRFPVKCVCAVCGGSFLKREDFRRNSLAIKRFDGGLV